MAIVHFLVWCSALVFAFFLNQAALLDAEVAEELFWLTISLSVLLFCYIRYPDRLLIFGFAVYIIGQLFDVLDSIPSLENNLLIIFDTGLKNLGFIIICLALFKRVQEKRSLISQLTEEISHKEALQSELEHAAFHDELTKIQNRKALFNRLNKDVSNICSVLYLDLDGFKQANDQLGHSTGDDILVTFSQQLSDAFGSKNVYRIGGDEFVALHNQPLTTDNIKSLKSQLKVQGNDFEMTVSIGLHPVNDNETPQQWIHLADLNMFADKASKATPKTRATIRNLK